jgi:release factor glutamine methyltransferase
VPTPSEEISGNDIEVSWAGGIDGREIIDKFLPQINVLFFMQYLIL